MNGLGFVLMGAIAGTLLACVLWMRVSVSVLHWLGIGPR